MELLWGLIAGFGATAPMTICMLLLHPALPPSQQYPLPPSEITSALADRIHLSHALGTEGRSWLTLIGHFGYGAAMGTIYASLTSFVPSAPLPFGILFGLAVWGVSYLIALPWLGLFPPARQEPLRRNLLMIGAHLVWGAALGSIFELLAARWSTL